MMAGLWSFSPDLRYVFWNRCSHYSCLTWWLYQTSSLDHFNDDNPNYRPFLLTPHNFCVLWHNGLFPISLLTFRFLCRWLVSLKCDKGWINHPQSRYDQSLFLSVLIVNAFDHVCGFRWLDIFELSGPFPYIMIAPMYVVYPHCIILPFHRMILAKLWLNKWVWVLMTHFVQLIEQWITIILLPVNFWYNLRWIVSCTLLREISKYGPESPVNIWYGVSSPFSHFEFSMNYGRSPRTSWVSFSLLMTQTLRTQSYYWFQSDWNSSFSKNWCYSIPIYK